VPPLYVRRPGLASLIVGQLPQPPLEGGVEAAPELRPEQPLAGHRLDGNRVNPSKAVTGLGLLAIAMAVGEWVPVGWGAQVVWGAVNFLPTRRPRTVPPTVPR
jgi:hypothetical protein